MHWLNNVLIFTRPSKDDGQHGSQQQLDNIWLSNTARSRFGDNWSVQDLFRLNKLGLSSAAKSGQVNAIGWQEIIQDVRVRF